MKTYDTEPGYQKAKEKFREIVTTSELSRESIIRAWEAYLACNARINLITGFDGGMPDPHVTHIVNGLRSGETHHTDGTKASLGHFDFELATIKPFGRPGAVGELLEGLEDDVLAKAVSFCTGMDNVGWSTGDIDQMYPNVETEE